MNYEQFNLEVDRAFNRSKRLLTRKGFEYGIEEDRLIQFKQAGAMECKAPSESLFSMADKHITSIAHMVKDPTKYSKKEWNRKLDDLRNYTFLLDALLTDMGIE